MSRNKLTQPLKINIASSDRFPHVPRGFNMKVEEEGERAGLFDPMLKFCSFFKFRKRRKWGKVYFPLRKIRLNRNYLRTAKYTLLTFIPLNLFEQLRKLNNLYFLVILGISMIPGVSPVLPFALITPPIFLIGSAMIKDFIDDFGRYMEDLKANGRKVKTTSHKSHRRFTHSSKSNINPGDYLEIRENEEIPCDMISLFSTKEKGTLFIETSNLDGETNLKRKQSIFEEELCPLDGKKNPKVRSRLRKKSDFVEITVERNTKRLDQFDGRMKISYREDKQEVDSKEYVLSIENFLCGGCVLKETKMIQGFAVFCGKQTKMYKNLKRKRSKWGSMERKINLLLLVIIIFQEILIFCLIVISFIFETRTNSSTYSFWEGILGKNLLLRNHWYLEPYFLDEESLGFFWNAVSKYMTFFVLFGYFIPMSVFVTFTIILSIQTKRLERKIKDGDVHIKARSSNLNPDLAGVDIIITDKTGTLTENNMVFAGCFSNDKYFTKKTIGDSEKPVLSQEDITDDVLHFLLCLAMNNTVTVRSEMTEEEEIVTKYGGESSDEVALVRDLLSNSPVRLLERRKEQVTVQVFDDRETQHEFEVLETLPFTSARKRMSVIIRNPVTDQFILYIKGGDSEMFRRSSTHINSSKIKKNEEKEDNNNIEKYEEAVMNFAKSGYRTLVVGYRLLDPIETEIFLTEFRKLKLSLQDNREAQMDEMMEEIEQQITIVGVTAIEDRLQEGVPEVIRFFRSAGLKFVVMTGDQMETAVQASIAAGIISPTETPNNSDKEVILHQLSLNRLSKEWGKDDNYEELVERLLDQVVQDSRSDEHSKKHHEMVVNEDILEGILGTKRLAKRLWMMIKKCRSVVFSRVTPLQKAILTKKIQSKLGKRCLAIGDGANDVSMIQNADIGVGIMGREGSQAARAADFALPRFKLLLDLLCVEGRYSYFRCSSCLLISLFKNFPITCIHLIYLGFNGFSSLLLIDSWILTLFNLIFLALPPAWMGTFDIDVNEKTLRKSPHLYKSIRKDPYSGVCNIIAMYVKSTLLSIILFVVLYVIVSGKYGMDNVSLGLVMFMVTTKTWNLCIILFWVMSFASYVLFCLIYSSLRVFWDIRSFYFVVFEVLPVAEVYLWMLLIVGVWVVPVISLRWISVKYFPSQVDKTLNSEDSKNNCYVCCCKKKECVLCRIM